MLKKMLSGAGKRILKAIKKLSRKKRVAIQKASPVESTLAESSPSSIRDHEELSLSWSMASFDTKSVDTYMTIVGDADGTESIDSVDEGTSTCYCCCEEHEENQRNENRENEMII